MKLYLHPYQLIFYSALQRVKMLICGRGWGKTTILALEMYAPIKDMEGCRGALVGRTYRQLISKVLPPVFAMWRRMGLEEYSKDNKYGTYVFGVKPPKHFNSPLQPIKEYDNIISFSNGSVIELLSMDRKDLNLGGNFDFMIVDEVQNIEEDKFKKEYLVALRGSDYSFVNSKHFKKLVMTGTNPWKKAGQWVYKYEELSKKKPGEYFYMMRSSYDNIAVLGEQYFETLEEQIGPLMFAVEIKNQRVKFISSGFYPSFKEDVHVYSNAYQYNFSQDGLDVTQPVSDYMPMGTLCISFDFGAKITSCIIAQEDRQENVLKFINMIYRTNEMVSVGLEEDARPLQAVMKSLVSTYQNHKGIIEIYGDHTGHNKSDKSKTSYEIVEAYLKAAGLRFINKAERTPNPKHALKYHVINQTLAEENKAAFKVRINEINCAHLILSIQTTPILDDFQKDKSSERKSFEELPPEMQTHFSDAFDYIIMAKNTRYYNQSVNAGGVSVTFTRT